MIHTTFAVAIVVLFAIAGGLAYRWRGMNENDVPRLLRNRWARRGLFVGLLALAAWWAEAGWWTLLAAPLAVVGTIIGHGSYQDLATVERPDNEWFRWPLNRVCGPEPPYSCWRDFTGLALTGLLVTVPIAVLPGVAFWYAGVGVLKAGAYAIRWQLAGLGKTEMGELGWGAMAVGLLALA